MTARARYRLCAAALLVLGGGAPVPAQGPVRLAQPVAAPVAATTADGNDLLTRADRLEYDRVAGVLQLIGNAVVRRAGVDEELRADRIVLNERTGDIRATGNVRFREGERVWTGETLDYNMRSKLIASPGRFVFLEEPFHITGERVVELASGEFLLENVSLTTCDPNDPFPPYRVQARKLNVRNEDRVKGYGTTFYFSHVPVFWTPYWYKSLDPESGWHFEPGYNSRLGAYLLTSYRYRLNPWLRAVTHLDYRTRRGVAVGQDFAWREPETSDWSGFVKFYYADDRKPYEDDEDPSAGLVESERYRIRFGHQHTFSPRDYLLTALHYVSDPDLLEDFFARESRATPVPENYAQYTHRDDAFTAGLVLQPRLNDFYETVTRLPRAYISLPRQQILDSNWYYAGETAAERLERLFVRGSANEDYDAVRIDSDHMFLYPTRHFGFLNVIPRVGYRGTYYSTTRGTEVVESFVTSTTTNSIVTPGATNVVVSTSTSTSVTTRVTDAGADLRNLYQFGVETSFKMFKVLDDGPVLPLRHIGEPYANYTIVPKPNLRPADLYAFDGVDALDKEHSILLGFRNKLQTKRLDVVHDLVDLDAYFTYLLDEADNGNRYRPLTVTGKLRPRGGWWLDFDTQYDLDASELREFNTRATLGAGSPLSLEAEFRHRLDASSLVSGRLTFRPNLEWSASLYARHEAETSQLEEIAATLERNMECLAWRAGVGLIPSYVRSDGSEREDEWQLRFEVWLTDFPNVGVGGTASNN